MKNRINQFEYIFCISLFVLQKFNYIVTDIHHFFHSSIPCCAYHYIHIPLMVPHAITSSNLYISAPPPIYIPFPGNRKVIAVLFRFRDWTTETDQTAALHLRRISSRKSESWLCSEAICIYIATAESDGGGSWWWNLINSPGKTSQMNCGEEPHRCICRWNWNYLSEQNRLHSIQFNWTELNSTRFKLPLLWEIF